MSKSPKTNTDNSLLSAYVDSPHGNEKTLSRISPQSSDNLSSVSKLLLTLDQFYKLFNYYMKSISELKFDEWNNYRMADLINVIRTLLMIDKSQ